MSNAFCYYQSMNAAQELPPPLNTFVVDLPANQYKDFELPADSAYPLKGVTYPVDYGYLPRYLGEDGYELDLFVGNSTQGLCGYVIVDRGKGAPHEHKFYVCLADWELQKILAELEPVLVSHGEFENPQTLIENLAGFKEA